MGGAHVQRARAAELRPPEVPAPQEILAVLRRRVPHLRPQGNVAFYSKQAAFKLKEDIRVYADESKTRELLTIKARAIFDISAAYDVVDATSGEKVGVLKRKGLKSILKDEWAIMDASDREIGTIAEDSMLMALLRRFLSNLIPQSFHLTIGSAQVGVFNQHFNPFLQKIDLDFSADTNGLLDRRLAIAAGVLICAIEGKQQQA